MKILFITMLKRKRKTHDDYDDDDDAVKCMPQRIKMQTHRSCL